MSQLLFCYVQENNTIEIMLFRSEAPCHDLIVNNLFKHHHLRFEPEEGQEFFRNDLNRLFPLIRYKKTGQ